MIRFELKKRNESGQWKHIDIGVFAGKKLKELFSDLDGQEVVIEFLIDDQRCFFCGNQYWLERMQRKGPAASFDEALNRLRDTRPDLLEEKIPAADLIHDVFPGAKVESHELG